MMTPEQGTALAHMVCAEFGSPVHFEYVHGEYRVVVVIDQEQQDIYTGRTPEEAFGKAGVEVVDCNTCYRRGRCEGCLVNHIPFSGPGISGTLGYRMKPKP